MFRCDICGATVRSVTLNPDNLKQYCEGCAMLPNLSEEFELRQERLQSYLNQMRISHQAQEIILSAYAHAPTFLPQVLTPSFRRADFFPPASAFATFTSIGTTYPPGGYSIKVETDELPDNFKTSLCACGEEHYYVVEKRQGSVRFDLNSNDPDSIVNLETREVKKQCKCGQLLHFAEAPREAIVFILKSEDILDLEDVACDEVVCPNCELDCLMPQSADYLVCSGYSKTEKGKPCKTLIVRKK